MEKIYVIVKFRKGKPSKRLTKVGRLTLEEAKRYCSRPDTRGTNWFCGFTSIN